MLSKGNPFSNLQLRVCYDERVLFSAPRFNELALRVRYTQMQELTQPDTLTQLMRYEKTKQV